MALTDLGELATREIAAVKKPCGLEQNKEIAALGGEVSKVAKDNLEKKLGKSVISKENSLNYQYKEEINKQNEKYEINNK